MNDPSQLSQDIMDFINDLIKQSIGQPINTRENLLKIDKMIEIDYGT